MSKPLPISKARNRRDTAVLYALWSLVIWEIGMILIVAMAASGCSELANYGRQHGWN